jgi:hypothetical protein
VTHRPPLSPPLPPAQVPPDQARRVGLYLLAARDAWRRLYGRSGQARQQWAAAVECVWWIAAVDDQLKEVYVGQGSTERQWGPERHKTSGGRVLGGLMWLRHRHVHDAADSAYGHVRPWNYLDPQAPPKSIGLYLSPGYRWRPAADIEPRSDWNKHLRPLYERNVADRPLELPLEVVLLWLERSMPGLGVDLARLQEDGDSRDLL